jgi:hypothetical protein
LPGLLSLLVSCSAWHLAREKTVLVGLNGCTDDSLARLLEIGVGGASLEILELSQANKNATWNCLVQRAWQMAPYLVFLDADVRPHPQALERLLARLDGDPGVNMVCALPRPTTAFLSRPSWYQRARVLYADSPWVSYGSGEFRYPRGNLYAIRSAKAAEIRLPERELVGDDLFLGQLLGSTAVIETDSLVYFSPPGFSDHLRQRARQRRGLEGLKQRFPELRPRPAGPPPSRRISSPGELVYFAAVNVVERLARSRARDASWSQIRSARTFSGPPVQGARYRLLLRLQAFMIRMGERPAMRRTMGWMYRMVARAVACILVCLPGVRAFRVSGSLENRRMAPGLSDIDGEIILAELSPEQERRAVRRIVAVYGAFRYLLPILQEPFLQRASDDRCAQRCGEPWTVTASYRVLSGCDGRQGKIPQATGEAFASLMLRRFLRFYTRQALAGAGRESHGYLRLHQRGLASTNALLRAGSGEAVVTPLEIEEEMARPASEGMRQIFAWYRELSRADFRVPTGSDPDRLGYRLASVGYLIVRDLAGALSCSVKAEDLGPVVVSGAGPDGLDSYLKHQLGPLIGSLEGSGLLGKLPCLLSRCGPQNWQHRLYLVLPPGVEQSVVEDCFCELQALWRRHRAEFPASYFGVFPNPGLLPHEALGILDLSYGAGWEKLSLGSRYPEQMSLAKVGFTRAQQMIRRNLAEQAVPLMRRLDLATASARTRMRFLDVFFGLLPAAAVFRKTRVAALSLPVAVRDYQREFDDDYCEFLDSLPAESLWFEGPLLDPARLARIHQRWYPVLRQALDRHWQTDGGPGSG